jgi:hypothetical protein
VLKFQDEHAQEQEQKAKFRQPGRMVNAHDILSSYAQWLQADMTDLFFDWLEMGRICGDIWRNIKDEVETFEDWDETSFPGKPVMEPTTDILLRDEQFPRFLMAAYMKMGDGLDAPPLDDYSAEGSNADSCLTTLGRCHHATAIKRLSPGPIHLSNFYVHWPTEDWEPRWMAMKQIDELRNMFYDTNAQVLKRSPSSAGKDPVDVNEFLNTMIPIFRTEWDKVYEACLKLGYFPDTLHGERAYTSVQDSIVQLGERVGAMMTAGGLEAMMRAGGLG